MTSQHRQVNLCSSDSRKVASVRQCKDLFKSNHFSEIIGAPLEHQLIESSIATGAQSQKAIIYQDRANNRWYAKSDKIHQELQTGAEVISAWIYRELGYQAPETYITNRDGRQSISRMLPKGTEVTLQSSMPNTTPNRALRIFAAYLRDWDRLRLGPNNRLLEDGSVALYDFGGTLGARARGEHKPGEIVSNEIGSFDMFESGVSIYRGFSTSELKENHPWKKMTPFDVIFAFKKLEKLSDEKIIKIVERAQYSDKKNEKYMINALRERKKNLLSYLKEELFFEVQKLPGGIKPTVSFEQLRALYEAVESISVGSQEVLLFRGREKLTKKVQSRIMRDSSKKDSIESYKHTLRNYRRWPKEELRGATPLNWLVTGHVTQYGGAGYFVSTSTRPEIASGSYAGGNAHRYIYVLVAPKKEVIDVSEHLEKTGYTSKLFEREFIIPHEATPYIRLVFDKQNNQIVDLPN